MLAGVDSGLHVCEVFAVRRGQVLILLALASGVMSVLLAVAVNVATGGTLPGRWAGYAGWAWPAVGVLAVVTVALAFWQQNLQDRSPGHQPQPEPEPVPVPAELPDQSARFAGRVRELAALRVLVDGGARVIAIAGTPGVGKSSLALHLARAMRPSYPDGQLYVRLRGASAEPVDPAMVLARFLSALGANAAELTGDTETLSARFRTRLAGRRVLILLDDAAGETQVRPLLPGDDRCLTIVTSRPVLGGLGEAALFDLGVMGEPEASDVFVGLVGPARVAAEPAATAEVLRACGYLPLAVGIAGGRLRARPGWTVADLAARLADERHRLDELRLGNSEVRASFTTSYADLAEPDRRLFRRLGIHPGAEVDTGAAAALAGDGEREVGAALERLADVRLVEAVGPDRYWRHDLIRLFAAERLAAEEPPADQEAAFARLVAWYAETASTASPDWLRAELDNMVAAIRRAADTGAGPLAWSLVDAMTPLPVAFTDPVVLTPFWRDIRLWERLVEFARTDPDRRRLALGLVRLGRAYEYDGYVEPALEHLGAGLDALADLDAPQLRAELHKSMANALRNAGRYREALAQYEQALTLYSGADEEETADVLDGLGTLHITRHEPAEARRHLERAMRIRRAAGRDPSKAAWTELLLGIVHMQEGRFAQTRTHCDRAMATFRRLGDRAGEAYTLRELGWLAWNEKRYDDAIRLHADAERIFTEVQLPVGIGMAQESGGDALLGAGDTAGAITAYERSAATFRLLGDRHREGLSLLKLAEALGGARSAREQAERLLDGLDVPEADAIRRRLDGASTAREGEPASGD